MAHHYIAATLFASLLLSVASEEKCPLDCQCIFDQHYMSCERINIQLPVPIPTSITQLKLSNCFLGETWPAMPDNYSNIESLTITRGQFKAIAPQAFDELTDLHTLILNDNLLESIDKEVLEGLPNLKELDLSDNKVKSIPDDTFEHNPKLNKLLLNNNLGIELSSRSFAQPEDTDNMLGEVELRSCGLTSVPTSTICHSKVPKLHHLDLGHNDFRNLTELQFKHAPGLRFLNLDNCQIGVIKRETLGSLKDLDTLYLTNNQLTEIDHQAFDDFFQSLRYLYVNSNQLSRVSCELFNFQHLHVLNVSNNPWECSCENSWLQDYPVQVNNSNFHVECASPEEYKGMNALKVMKEDTEDCTDVCSSSTGESSENNNKVALYVMIPLVILVVIIVVIIVVKICKQREQEKRGSTQYSLVYKPTTEKA